MKAGGSKAKGSSFERRVCKELSLWVSHGKDEDLFWRSAMSGGRATVSQRRGVKLRRQAGDITATAPEGHVLTDKFYIEVKHVKDLQLLQFLTKRTGALENYWTTAKREAKAHGRRPWLILKQNRAMTILVCWKTDVDEVTGNNYTSTHVKYGAIEIHQFDAVTLTPFAL